MLTPPGLKAFGFNCLKVIRFQSYSFNCQPAPLHTGRTTWEQPEETAWVKVPVPGTGKKAVLDIITELVISVLYR